ncbi:hypothetical protein GCM10023170_076090 [Phytohabitans houttuyneae]|uniref:hypothetical protein n=1 Tax=Phytohabitans houttuyneae TaxID=1076126 RepID=UPI0031F0C6DE
MINLSDRLPSHYSKRARTELSAAWEHLLTAASEAARQVGDTSRTGGSVARERVALARLALRGQRPTSHWRWAGAGLAAGVVIGAVAAVVISRRAHPADPDAPQQPANAPSTDQTQGDVTGRDQAADPPPTPTPPATDSGD